MKTVKPIHKIFLEVSILDKKIILVIGFDMDRFGFDS